MPPLAILVRRQTTIAARLTAIGRITCGLAVTIVAFVNGMLRVRHVTVTARSAISRAAASRWTIGRLLFQRALVLSFFAHN
jgi:hypothetical protein